MSEPESSLLALNLRARRKKTKSRREKCQISTREYRGKIYFYSVKLSIIAFIRFFVQFMDSLSAWFMDILTKIIKRPNDWQNCVYANVKRRVLWWTNELKLKNSSTNHKMKRKHAFALCLMAMIGLAAMTDAAQSHRCITFLCYFCVLV